MQMKRQAYTELESYFKMLICRHHCAFLPKDEDS